MLTVSLALTLLVLIVSGCKTTPTPRNVLLISIDSLRADHLGVYGYGRDTSPVVDALARGGVRFSETLSPTSWTLPAHVTLLTGRTQENHRTIRPEDHIGDSETLLAEIFSRHGFETAGLYSGPFLDRSFGFDRGFDRYVSCMSKLTSIQKGFSRLNSSHRDTTNPCLAEKFAEWLHSRGDKPFFALVHMWDVHYDYLPPAEYRKIFDTGYTGELTGRRIAFEGFPLDASPRDVAFLKSLYDGELRYTDATIGHMLELLHERALLRDTLVVVTADHGEEFLEHGGKGHKRTLYDEVIHVPLIFNGPGVPAGKVIDAPVSLADVAPTILRMTGLPVPGNVDGHDLSPRFRSQAAASPPVFGALYLPSKNDRDTYVPRITMARTNDRKLLYDYETKTWEEYDLTRDPGEKHPLPPDDALRGELSQFLAKAEGSLQTRQAATQDPVPAQVEERLRALGYIE